MVCPVDAARRGTSVERAGVALMIGAGVTTLGNVAGALGGMVGLAALLLVAIVARRIAPVLVARYDLRLLRPPGRAAAVHTLAGCARTEELEAVLRAWCVQGCGSGARALFEPWAVPQVAQRLAVAGCEASWAGIRPALERLCRELDGSDTLDHCASAGERMRLRMRVKLHDCMWWRMRQCADPWDCGYFKDDALAWLALSDFLPRRATLIVATDLEAASIHALLHGLEARAAGFAHPVRVLIVATLDAGSALAHAPASVPVTRLLPVGAPATV